MTVDQGMTFVFVGDVEVGARVSASVTDGGFRAAVDVEGADVVLTYCTTQSALESVYYETEGLLSRVKPGTILVDLSPSTVTFARELGAMALVSDCHALDAPLVVRSLVAADAFEQPGNLGMLVGGEADIYKKVEPLLRAIARTVMWMGESGSGQSAKAAVTLQTAAALVGIVEALASLGTGEVSADEEEVADFLLAMGSLTAAQEAFVEALDDESFDGTFTIEHLMGEVSAALQSCDEGDLILPQAESCYRLMELLALVGGVSYNPAALKLVFADEDTSKHYGLDWSRAEGTYEHANDDHECSCGHHHGDDDDDDLEIPGGYLGFSSN